MSKQLLAYLAEESKQLQAQGLYKTEGIIQSPQQTHIQTNQSNDVINLCANNYLGLANHPTILSAAKDALDRWGYGVASVRFICGTQSIHKELEQTIAQFLSMEDCILYGSCFDANTGLFETLLNEQDAIISDSLNHASIIDGIRLCKAQRHRYAHSNMQDLESCCRQSKTARFRLIATDGVFSMDGEIAKLNQICEIAEQHDCLVMVDDSHALGFLGENGRGTPEYCQVQQRVDIITGTLGKAMGGASGGFTAGPKSIIDWLRQRSRPYLFSNSLPPVICASAIKAFQFLDQQQELRQQLLDNTTFFRDALQKLGFKIIAGSHPIIPIMLFEEKLAMQMAKLLHELGIFVVAFSYPVVPKQQARIRVQMSAAHTQTDLELALDAFEKVGLSLGVLS